MYCYHNTTSSHLWFRPPLVTWDSYRDIILTGLVMLRSFKLAEYTVTMVCQHKERTSLLTWGSKPVVPSVTTSPSSACSSMKPTKHPWQIYSGTTYRLTLVSPSQSTNTWPPQTPKRAVRENPLLKSMVIGSMGFERFWLLRKKIYIQWEYI